MRWCSRLLSAFCVFALAQTVALAAPESGPVRVAIVGLVHGHVSGFLDQLPTHKEVQLVGVSDPDAALRQKYSEKYHLDPKIFFPTEDAMIEATHPQAVLVYTSIAGHRRAIEDAARLHNIFGAPRNVLGSYEQAFTARSQAAKRIRISAPS